MNIIELKNINFTYSDKTQALKNINIIIEECKTTVILGENGAGKSTLFTLLNGIIKPNSGEYRFNGNIVNYSKKELFELRKNIGIVFQEPDNQIFSSSVYDEIAFGPRNLKIPEYEIDNIVKESAKETDVTEYFEKPVHFLSYGQKKRVSISSILAMKPKVIIFDEPSACLDVVQKDKLYSLYKKLKNKGITIIISTHDIDFAYKIADNAIVLKNGECMFNGKIDDLFANDKIVQKSCLKYPPVYILYNELVKKHIIKNTYCTPKTIEDIITILNNV